MKKPHAPTEEKYIWVLAEKLGDEIYDILSAPRPDPFLTFAIAASSKLKEKQKRTIKEQIAHYLNENENESYRP